MTKREHYGAASYLQLQLAKHLARDVSEPIAAMSAASKAQMYGACTSPSKESITLGIVWQRVRERAEGRVGGK